MASLLAMDFHLLRSKRIFSSSLPKITKSRKFKFVAATFLGASASFLLAPQALCASSEKAENTPAKTPEDDKSDPVKAIIKQYLPLAQKLGFSGFLGVCSAIAFKKVSKMAATAIGVVFVGLQTLQYLGYINIDYNKVQSEAEKALDVNKDGKLDEKDLYVIWDKVKGFLTSNLPGAGSFTTGFALGFYLNF